jgi:hypothetical protein
MGTHLRLAASQSSNARDSFLALESESWSKARSLHTFQGGT